MYVRCTHSTASERAKVLAQRAQQKRWKEGENMANSVILGGGLQSLGRNSVVRLRHSEVTMSGVSGAVVSLDEIHRKANIAKRVDELEAAVDTGGVANVSDSESKAGVS